MNSLAASMPLTCPCSAQLPRQCSAMAASLGTMSKRPDTEKAGFISLRSYRWRSPVTTATEPYPSIILVDVGQLPAQWVLALCIEASAAPLLLARSVISTILPTECSQACPRVLKTMFCTRSYQVVMPFSAHA